MLKSLAVFAAFTLCSIAWAEGEPEVIPIAGASDPLPLVSPSPVVESSEADSPEGPTAEATRAIVACQETCARAQESRSGAPACRSRARLPSRYFCANTDRRFVNPFAILRGEGPGADLCLHSLLVEASREASAALLRSGESRVPGSLRPVFQLAESGSAVACSSTRATSPAAEDLRPTLSRAAVEEVTSTQEQSYCRAVVPPPCAQLGGRMTAVAGTQACVAGGVVVDSSCLTQTPAKLEALSSAISALRTTGLSCLRGRPGRPGIAPEVGQGLADHLSGNPKTQICCTTSSCSSGVPGFVQPGGTVSATAAGDSYGNAQGGTIRIPPAQLTASDFRGTLFHEMLHQMGLCDSSEHNSFGSISFTNWAITKPAGGCPAGYAERVIGQGTPRFTAVGQGLGQIIRFNPPPRGLRSDFNRRFPRGATSLLRSRNPDVVMTPADLDHFATLVSGTAPICLKLNSCGTGVLPPPPPFIEKWDNVYACEAACYSSRQMASYSEAEKTQIRESCRAPSNHPAGTPLVSHDPGTSGTRCVSAPEF